MTETGNFNINNRIEVRVKGSPTTSSEAGEMKNGETKIKGKFAKYFKVI